MKKKNRFDLWIFLDDHIQRAAERRDQGSDPQRIVVQWNPEPTDYDARAELDRAEVMRTEYRAILEAIDRELSDLEAEYVNATERRRPAIDKRRLTLLSKRATTTRQIHSLDRIAEKNYAKLSRTK